MDFLAIFYQSQCHITPYNGITLTLASTKKVLMIEVVFSDFKMSIPWKMSSSRSI